jgi:cytochrome c oxidase cbb3-type subunit I
VGLFVMALDLTLAGVFQGYYWASLQPWEVSVEGSQPFWILRVFAGLAVFAGQMCFFYNLYRTWQIARHGEAPADTQLAPVPQAS